MKMRLWKDLASKFFVYQSTTTMHFNTYKTVFNEEIRTVDKGSTNCIQEEMKNSWTGYYPHFAEFRSLSAGTQSSSSTNRYVANFMRESLVQMLETKFLAINSSNTFHLRKGYNPFFLNTCEKVFLMSTLLEHHDHFPSMLLFTKAQHRRDFYSSS